MHHDDFGTTAVPGKRPGVVDGGARHIACTIISHPNMQRVGEMCFMHGSRLPLARNQPDFCNPANPFSGKPLADPFISRDPLELHKDSGGSLRIEPSPKTEAALDGVRLDGPRRVSPEALDHGLILTLADRVVLLVHRAGTPDAGAPDRHGLVGYSDGVSRLRREIDRVADLETPVLLRGASGTGKELVAHALHHAGRRTGPCVCVNLGALSPALAAAELFGSVKGAYTGADRPRIGFFRAAHGGTLFLDEVGEAPPEVQVLMLRALETGEVTPVGAQVGTPFQARLVAATDADLEKKMRQDSFKSPLFHRLAGYEIRLDPLMHRREDFGRLFVHFARPQLREIGEVHRLEPSDPYADPWLPADLVVRLLQYGWPGNVRQLRNVVRQLVIGCRGEPRLRAVSKVVEWLDEASAPVPRGAVSPPAAVSGDAVTAAMEAAGWDIKKAAEALGMSRGSLYLLIEKIPGLRKAADLSVADIDAALAAHDGDMDAAAAHLRVSGRALRRRYNQVRK